LTRRRAQPDAAGGRWLGPERALRAASVQAWTHALRDTAARFEPGSANMIGITALAASVEMFCQVRRIHGHDAIGRRVIELAERLDHSLRQLGVATRLPVDAVHRSGILTFNVPDVEPSEVRRRALEEKVVVSCRDGGVRASIHAYNDDEDLDRLTRVVAQVMQAR